MSDRITIINNDDGTVDVNLNGENIENIPTSNLDSTIHAVQWYGDHGEVEYNDHNEEITDFSPFAQLLKDRDAELDRRVDQAIQEEPTPDVMDRNHRDSLLYDSDWVVVRSVELGVSIPKDWEEYRQALRDVTNQSGFPGNVTWPSEPNYPEEFQT